MNLKDISEFNKCETVSEDTFSQTNLRSVSPDSGCVTISCSNETTSLQSEGDVDCVRISLDTSNKLEQKDPKGEVTEIDGNTSNNGCDNMEDDVFHTVEFTQEIDFYDGKTNAQPSTLDTSPQLMHFRPESRTDTCSSYYVSAECSPCASLHNGLEQTPDIYDNNPSKCCNFCCCCFAFK
ncbi:hypothetical protein CDAR_513261 [Caerostris darwini]|nr:hypothetical protein CDAR_513261 [Caerostris darwini]